MALSHHKNNHFLGRPDHGRGHLRTQFIAIQSENCIACGTCIKECPKGVIGKVRFLRHEHAHIDNAAGCVGCKKCVKSCPNQAIIELPQPDRSPRPLNGKNGAAPPRQDKGRVCLIKVAVE